MSYIDNSGHRNWGERGRESMQIVWKCIIWDIINKRWDPHGEYIKLFLEDNCRKRMYMHPDEEEFEF